MDFDTALNLFVKRLNKTSVDYHQKHFPNSVLPPDRFEVEHGKKFAKIVMVADLTGGKSVHCFVAKQDSTTKGLGTIKAGDILKAASWKAPAKHVRGSIFAEDFGGYGVGVYGANYLR